MNVLDVPVGQSDNKVSSSPLHVFPCGFVSVWAIVERAPRREASEGSVAGTEASAKEALVRGLWDSLKEARASEGGGRHRPQLSSPYQTNGRG